MMSRKIDAAALTTFDVDPDGGYVRIHVRDHDGAPASLVLPASCLNQLLMSVPLMVQTALRNRYGDDSLRLVHPLDSYCIELGPTDTDGVQRFILTLETGGGFSASFALTSDLLRRIAHSILKEVVPNAKSPTRLS